MKTHNLLIAAALVAFSAPGFSQSADPLTIAAQTTAEVLPFLPANTEVTLRMNKTLTTKGDELQEGDTFSLTLVHDVLLEDRIVIPKGARAGGKVTWLTSKGAFGKSGKMDISIEYLEVGGRRLPLEGEYRQEGEGNTVATVGGVVVAGVFAAFITGKSGVIPQGRELTARTREDLPVRFASARPVPVAAEPAEVPVAAAQIQQAPVKQPSYGLAPAIAN